MSVLSRTRVVTLFRRPDLAAALDRVRALGGEVIYPGERWGSDSEGSPFGLALTPGAG